MFAGGPAIAGNPPADLEIAASADRFASRPLAPFGKAVHTDTDASAVGDYAGTTRVCFSTASVSRPSAGRGTAGLFSATSGYCLLIRHRSVRKCRIETRYASIVIIGRHFYIDAPVELSDAHRARSRDCRRLRLLQYERPQ
jgi:hypothetical protein